MIEVQPELLGFASRIAQIRKAPAETDGARSWCRHYGLAYDGADVLTVTSTDNRLVLVSRVPVVGRAESWSAIIESSRFDHVRFLRGGRYKIGVQGRRLFLGKENQRLRFPLADQPPGTAYPLANVSLQGTQPITVSSNGFRAVLRFLTLGSGAGGAENPSQVLSYFRDGQAMTNLRSVYLVMVEGSIAFDIDLYRQDAKRIYKWLDLATRGGAERSEALEIVRFQDTNGRHYYRVCDGHRRHTLYCPAARAPFPRQGIDLIRSAGATIACHLDRDQVLQLSRFVGARSRSQRLVCSFITEGADDWTLHVEDSEAPNQRSGGPIPAIPVGTPAPETAASRFEVGARNLYQALRRFRPGQILLRYLPQVSYLSIQGQPLGAGEVSGRRSEAFIRTSEHSSRVDGGNANATIEVASPPPATPATRAERVKDDTDLQSCDRE